MTIRTRHVSGGAAISTYVCMHVPHSVRSSIAPSMPWWCRLMLHVQFAWPFTCTAAAKTPVLDRSHVPRMLPNATGMYIHTYLNCRHEDTVLDRYSATRILPDDPPSARRSRFVAPAPAPVVAGSDEAERIRASCVPGVARGGVFAMSFARKSPAERLGRLAGGSRDREMWRTHVMRRAAGLRLWSPGSSCEQNLSLQLASRG